MVSTPAYHAADRGSNPARTRRDYLLACKNLALYIRDCVSLCLSDETLKAVGPFYLVSMPGEVKYPTSLHWNCVVERRGSAVVSTSACHAGGPGSRPGPGTLLGVKTWLSTLEIVYLCVFRMRH